MAETSINELTEAKYIGRTRADRIREIAREPRGEHAVTASRSPTLQNERPDTPPYYYVCVNAPADIPWNESAHILASRRFNPAMQTSHSNQQELMRYVDGGENGLTSVFASELGDLYASIVGESDLQLDYITVVPGPSGNRSPELKQLAITLADEYDNYYKELMARTKTVQASPRSLRQRWELQNESLSASRDLTSRSVLVLDGLCTTGATLTTATYYLHEAGAKDVISVCLGLTPGRKENMIEIRGSQAIHSDITVW